MIAEQGDEMQRDYWYDSSRMPDELATPEAIGHRGATQCGPSRRSQTQDPRMPGAVRADIAPSLLRSLFGAIRGHAVYRKSTFLLDQIGVQIFPDWVDITENPLIPRASASAPFDNEGVATAYRELVSGGVLRVICSTAMRRANWECRVPPVPVACATRASPAAASRSMN